MESSWDSVYADIEDLLAPQLALDTWERTLYYHLLRHTRLKGIASAHFAVGPLSTGLPISDFKVREVLRSLDAKGCIRIEDRSRHGHLIHVVLPSELPVLVRESREAPDIDIEALDFFSGRRYVEALLARQDDACFYCLRVISPESCELDHLVPQAERLDNSFRNVVASCHNCNKAKGSTSVVDFFRTRYRSGLLSEGELQSRLAVLAAIQSGELVPDIHRLRG
ncbi:MAG: hypothetical protein FD171_2255 [Actinobacteria bacterium]|nr:MAG: hypothetical protein FD171_2255 [Actinomycetota bacterium]